MKIEEISTSTLTTSSGGNTLKIVKGTMQGYNYISIINLDKPYVIDTLGDLQSLINHLEKYKEWM